EQREAMLHGIREGTVATDRAGRVTLANDEAKRLLGLDGDSIGRELAEIVPPGHARAVLSGNVDEPDQVVLVNDRVLVVNPILVGLLLGKAAVASERGIELRVSDDTRLPDEVAGARDLVTVVGNLVDNALDSVAPSGSGSIEISIRDDGEGILVRVHDSGPG